MKLHKNYLTLAALCLAAAGLAACGSSDGPDEPKPTPNPDGVKAGITTEVITRAEHINQIPQGGRMNLFVYNQNDISSSNLVFPEASATLGTDGVWTMSPELYLKDGGLRHAFILAVYPYVESCKAPKVYPVDVAGQQDVLYSGSLSNGLVSTTVPTARLQMKHALSMACFDFETSQYPGQGHITSLTIDGQDVAKTLNLDISTGDLTPLTKGATTIAVDAQAKAGDDASHNPSVWVAPFSTKQTGATLTITIDGKEYSAAFPEVTMKQGFQYGFHLILTPHGLVFRTDKIDEISLNDGLVDLGAAEGHGVMRIGMASNAQTFSFPIFEGVDVFGTINTGSGAANYFLGGQVPVTGGATVIVESWNTTGFELPDLENIESIDLSEY